MSSKYWFSNRYNIQLRITLDWEKYQKGNLSLPIKEFGKTKSWRFEIAEDQDSAVFIATWDHRMFPKNFDYNGFESLIEPYLKT
tara:strand:- start:903 stop:1154 length:252 start_codon:yes stop_codon:yes gene_type:complete